MTKVFSQKVAVPLPAAMVAIFGIGLIIGMFAGAAANQSGVDNSDAKFRAERLADSQAAKERCAALN
ncbi:hypothetical protein [Pseudomonas syringae]|uniref:Uncharacterized protein n=1 Tax=Pseudomonas syringae pv. actinidiae TaxID=103796 RepID=A0A2P0QHW3_PSESF|nr:hypothetical protein [Pseudomonas syringae]APQ06965.1 hypothetical protein PsaNZ47_29940 [Pseudomonas syringae pv. actinidiae]ARO44944.1 hypothetical protein [Pseudomonas syringae pv. actinidiae]ARO45047.1 hypothetical protein [Pseudomonas syringae pv. actinidiae]ARO45140.1 hypothetical protein [Pseudomonas syringae pv. actinidiae]MDU8389133.1 hypothetical protein [Pseudomonas syringae pv. actinidiae]